MSQASAVAVAKLSRTWSLGIVKIQVFDVVLASGNTTVLATADTMSSVYWGLCAGAGLQTAAPSYSSNAATFTITDPLAAGAAQVILFGV